LLQIDTRFKQTDMWMHEFVDAFVRGCICSWMQQTFVSKRYWTQTNRHLSAWVSGCIGPVGPMSLCACICLQMHLFVDAIVCGCICLQIGLFVDSFVCGCICHPQCLRMHLFVDACVRGCICSWMHLFVDTLVIHKQTDQHIHTHTDKHIRKQTDTHIHKQTDKYIHKQTDTYIHKQID